MKESTLKQYSKEAKAEAVKVIKTEGIALEVDKELLDDQKVLEVSTEVPEKAKIEKDDKQSFEDFKTVCKGQIDDKCLADYGTLEDEQLWEDTAKELFLQSKEYVPAEDTKTQGELEDKLEESKEIKTEDNIREITQAEKILLNIIKTVGDYELDDVLCETSPEGNVHIITKDGKDICTVSRSKFAINGDDTELIDELRENGYWKEDLEESVEDNKEYKNFVADMELIESGLKRNGITSPEALEIVDELNDVMNQRWASVEQNKFGVKYESKKTEDVEPEDINLGEDGLPVLENPYKMYWHDNTETYEIQSIHSYDLTDYAWARTTGNDYTGYWRVNNPDGSRVGIVEGFEEAVELLKDIDSKLTPHIDHT